MMLDEVIVVLRWGRESSLPIDLYVGSIERLAAAFRAALVRMERALGDCVASLRERVSTCPLESFLRFMIAPETFARLSAVPPDDQALLRFIEDSVSAELCRCGREFISDHSVWTALGDYAFFSAARNGNRPTSQKASTKVNSQFYMAPSVGGIPVDFGSPYAFSADMPVCGPDCSLPPSEHERLLRDLSKGLEGIGVVSPVALEVVRLFTRVIVLKKDSERPERFLSSSSPRYVGRTVFCNPDQTSIEILAEGFVHESIHGLLSAEQLQRPFVRDHARLSRAEVVSPWTGNVIPMDAFIEACFVWFGIWNFWRLTSGSGAFEEKRVEQLAKRSRLGFDGLPLVELLAGIEPMLSAEVLASIGVMQNAVRGCLERKPL